VEDLVLDSRTHELRRGSRSASLTRTEYALLETLMRRPGCIVPRDTLVEAGWGGGAEVGEGTLYVFIRGLRAKIVAGNERQLLHTARGVGYTLRADAP
jgi:DNA-binding response OmpR family regulator